MQNTISLDKVKIGHKGVILSVGGEGAIRRRLLEVLVRKIAPLGDPIEVFLRSYELTLRQEDAKKIQVCETIEEYRRIKSGFHKE